MASLTATGLTTSLPVAAANGSLLKMDTQGRVRTSRERRQAILDEFDQSGVSAAQFAELAGIRYSTFAGWVNRRRKTKSVPPARPSALRLVEAVIGPGPSAPNQGLLVHLPGGVRLEMASPTQLPLVVALVQALQPPTARC